MSDDKPIIIIKKGGGHGGHHGGAWKIAYADFVTAMMAFFMVMWLVNSASSPTKEAIASYFRKPGVFAGGSGHPIHTGGAGILDDAFVPAHPEETTLYLGRSADPRTGKSDSLGGEQLTMKAPALEGEEGSLRGHAQPSDATIPGTTGIADGRGLSTLELEGGGNAEAEALAQRIREALANSPELEQLLGIVDVKVDADGLNIEIMDTGKSSMFASGSARVLPEAQKAFIQLARLIEKLPNTIDIVGHTDATPFSGRRGGYSNWELSADRANAARRLLQEAGIPVARITSVVGKAAKELRVIEDPFAAANRRITMKMRFSRPERIDLSKDPHAFERLEDTSAPSAPPEKVHSFTANEVNNPAERSSERTTLPPPAATSSPGFMPRDKIFGDRPVVGPSDPFVGVW